MMTSKIATLPSQRIRLHFLKLKKEVAELLVLQLLRLNRDFMLHFHHVLECLLLEFL